MTLTNLILILNLEGIIQEEVEGLIIFVDKISEDEEIIIEILIRIPQILKTNKILEVQ